jgi:hypothetical protein
MRICVITILAAKWGGTWETSLYTVEVWVLGVGMSTLGAQTALYVEDRGLQVPMSLEHVYKWLLKLFNSIVQNPPQEAVVVFGYIEGPFLVSRTGCARECHAPFIEGPFLVSRSGHARERHAP